MNREDYIAARMVARCLRVTDCGLRKRLLICGLRHIARALCVIMGANAAAIEIVAVADSLVMEKTDE